MFLKKSIKKGYWCCLKEVDGSNLKKMVLNCFLNCHFYLYANFSSQKFQMFAIKSISFCKIFIYLFWPVLWNIDVNVKNCFGLFATHSFSNSRWIEHIMKNPGVYSISQFYQKIHKPSSNINVDKIARIFGVVAIISLALRCLQLAKVKKD